MQNKPFVDPKKQRVTISLGIPMYNELIKGNLHEALDNALEVGFDDIVILDDGSTDDSWTVLQDYAQKYPHIRIFRNENNSVISRGGNRWKFVVEKIAEKSPDWVVVKSADQIYSHKATIIGGDCFRKRLTDFYHKGIELVKLPLAHLWRSRTWYRADDVWGRDIATHSKAPIWRFSAGFNYSKREKTGAHVGWHQPTYFGYGKGRRLKAADINFGEDKTSWDIVILHLGHTTHNKKVLKFKWSMEAARANTDIGRSILMPPPENMPKVSSWIRYNGYKGFFEFNMVLKKAPSIWFADDTPVEPKPIPESMYSTILEYNKKRAEEYLKIYNKAYKNVKKPRSNVKKSKSNVKMARRDAAKMRYKVEEESFNDQKARLNKEREGEIS
jgi:glycosyltransferase involved in cell wall biosynthesis